MGRKAPFLTALVLAACCILVSLSVLSGGALIAGIITQQIILMAIGLTFMVIVVIGLVISRRKTNAE
ncbi:hypothetical protein [Candidatus Hecatella orcuttiae]|jgi:uncharacterized membrane protein YqjE|uniref:hypothetical protein n=1 Tax=Candidatus Hecatella orcuttiae TaxID=1935119 RepID=UPI002867B91E|nr:hypothetical protein [Candidatus Hecatella orcuttiae]